MFKRERHLFSNYNCNKLNKTDMLSLKINQAELIHVSWVKRDRMNMSILDAAYTDCLDNIQLEASYKGFMDGTRKGGKGPSHLERDGYKRTDQ